MGIFTQDNRKIQLINTSLAKDELLLQGFTGHEGISRLFHYDLRLHSENFSIPIDKVINKPATIKILQTDGSERFINGIISSFSQGGSSSTFAYYQATLVPFLWLFGRVAGFHIFQNQTIPDIVQSFLGPPDRPFEPRLTGTFQPREFCVQYRETNLNFISRLMEEVGIFYFFEHTADSHKLILGNDSTTVPKAVPSQPKVRYELSRGEGRNEEVVTEWTLGEELRSDVYFLRDYDFKQPSLDLTVSADLGLPKKLGIFDMPGKYLTKDEGENLAEIRLEEEISPSPTASGSSTHKGFMAGFTFKLEDHYRKQFNQDYLITSLYTSADQGANFESSEGDALDTFDYRNHFQCLPHPSLYRPPRTTPVPVIHGTQTARVTGPSGQEIFTDEFGRVKVKFFWDVATQEDETTSCFIRVGQIWAGKRWGATFIPRIGQEVIVAFLEGDPDRPIIVGSVYNGEQMPPYLGDGPDSKHANDPNLSGVKSCSTIGGQGFNELRFDDTKGKEQVFMHAQQSMDVRVRGAHRISVGANHLLVGGQGSDGPHGDYVQKVFKDKATSVGGEMNTKVEGKYSLWVGDKILEFTSADHYSSAAGTNYMDGLKVELVGSTEITLFCGGSFIQITPAMITIQAPLVMINSGGAANPSLMPLINPPPEPAGADTAKSGFPSNTK